MKLVFVRPTILGSASWVALLSIGLAGCASRSGYSSNPGKPPAMPTIAPGGSIPERVQSENDVVATALAAARNDDIDGALRAIKSVNDPFRRARMADEVVIRLSAQNAKAGAKLALGLATELEQRTAIAGAARELVREDPEFALRWATEIPAGLPGRRLTRAIVEELAAPNPRDAIERIRRLPASAARDDLLVLAAGVWGRRDPDAAIAWLRDQPEDAVKQRMTSSVGFEVAHTRPERAVQIAESLPAGRDRHLLFSAIGQTWVALDSKAALAWAGRLPAGEARDAAFAGVDTGIGVPSRRRNPGAPGLRTGTRTRGGVAAAATWPAVNSPAFEVWLAAQPPGMSREEAILEYIRQRGTSEPGAIGPLIESMPAGGTRDQAMSIYVDGLLLGPPGEAARYVRSLPRSERTDELIEKTARRWLLTNPDAAAQWLDQSTLPTHRKEQLMREAGR